MAQPQVLYMASQQHVISKLTQALMNIPPTHLYQDVDVIGMYLEGLHINQESNAD
jgi:hypothetical protein